MDFKTQTETEIKRLSQMTQDRTICYRANAHGYVSTDPKIVIGQLKRITSRKRKIFSISQIINHIEFQLFLIVSIITSVTPTLKNIPAPIEFYDCLDGISKIKWFVFLSQDQLTSKSQEIIEDRNQWHSLLWSTYLKIKQFPQKGEEDQTPLLILNEKLAKVHSQAMTPQRNKLDQHPKLHQKKKLHDSFDRSINEKQHFTRKIKKNTKIINKINLMPQKIQKQLNNINHVRIKSIQNDFSQSMKKQDQEQNSFQKLDQNVLFHLYDDKSLMLQNQQQDFIPQIKENTKMENQEKYGKHQEHEKQDEQEKQENINNIDEKKVILQAERNNYSQSLAKSIRQYYQKLNKQSPGDAQNLSNSKLFKVFLTLKSPSISLFSNLIWENKSIFKKFFDQDSFETTVNESARIPKEKKQTYKKMWKKRKQVILDQTSPLPLKSKSEKVAKLLGLIETKIKTKEMTNMNTKQV